MSNNTKVYTVDFYGVRTYIDIHTRLSDGFGFPAYYGANLDALWDCLTDLLCDTVHIELRNFDVLEKLEAEYAQKILSVFRDLKHAYHDEYYDFVYVFVFRGNDAEEIL